MNKLLIISYLFPPAGGIAVQRALSFAKYLPRCGFEVHVLSARNAAAPVQDPGLLCHLPPETTLHHALTPELPFYFRKRIWALIAGSNSRKPVVPSNPVPPLVVKGVSGWKTQLSRTVRRLLCPDPQVVWRPFAVEAAARIISRYGIEAALVTAPPFSAFSIGTRLKGRFPNLKLISDFRDDWAGFYLNAFDFLKDAYIRTRSEELERLTVEFSDVNLVVTEDMLENYRKRYPHLPPEKFALIPNGYDPDSFGAIASRPHNTGKLVLTHIGTVYSASSPRSLLEAVDGLPEQIRSNIEVRFIGRVADNESAWLNQRRANVRLVGFLPQAEALRYVEDTDYLLVIMTDSASLTGKVFEYMASGKPILALAQPGGALDRLLRETGAGRCVNPADREKIQALLTDSWNRLRSGEHGWQPNWESIRRYERPRIALELAEVIRAL